ncbi:MAG TPA: hypothetical protein VFO36_11595, partial [Nitrospiraceae bacterium]|nr:hypothetical protein [Nitrospiraceae bacterium]
MSSKPIPPLIQGVLLALVGIGLVTGSWLWRERTLAFVKSAQHSEATIVKMERARNGKSHFP